MLQAVRVGDATTPDHEVEVDLGSQLRTLYDQHYRSLVRMAAFYLDDVWTCEECVQDAFVKLLTGRRVTSPGTEGAYLRSVVLNGARSQLRKRKVRREKKPLADGPMPSPEPAALDMVIREDVLAAIRTLPAKQADVVVLRYYLDLSEAEIAAILGMAKGTVKSHAHRGLKRLAELLEDVR